MVSESDLGELIGECEFCGTDYRYEYEIYHPEVKTTCLVGCVCAEHLSGNYLDPRRRLSELKAKARRRDNFIKSGWSGNKRRYKNLIVLLVLKREGMQVVVDGYLGKKRYKTEKEAKSAAFDAVAWVMRKRPRGNPKH